jgi:hypothetical protein
MHVIGGKRSSYGSTLRSLSRSKRSSSPSGSTVSLRLKPVTLSLWLAVLTAAGTGDDGEGELPEWDASSADLDEVEAVLQAALAEPPSRYVSAETLRATAQAAFDAVCEAATRDTERASRRVRQLERLVGYAAPRGRRALERSFADLSPADYAAVSRLPLWEAMLYLGARGVETGLRKENDELLR